MTVLNLSLDPVFPDNADEHVDELYELLKTADHEPGHLENDEDKSTVGTTHVYDEPEDRGEGGSVDAPWGEKGTTLDGHPQADHQSDGVWNEHKKVRQGVLKNVLDSTSVAAKADQALLSKNFQHVAKGDFSSHSVQLQSKSVEKVSHPRVESLLEQVRRITGGI